MELAQFDILAKPLASLDRFVRSSLADNQIKLNRSFRTQDWLPDSDDPDHGERTRPALAQAQALAIVEHGRSQHAWRALVRVIMDDRAQPKPWQHALIVQLNAEGSQPNSAE